VQAASFTITGIVAAMTVNTSLIALTISGTTLNISNVNNNAQYNYLIQLPYNLTATFSTTTILCRMFYFLNQSTLSITNCSQNISWSFFTTTGTPWVTESSAISPLIINSAVTIQQFIFNLTGNNILPTGLAFGTV